MTEIGGSVMEKPKVEADSTLDKVKAFASDERFHSLPENLKDSAVRHAAFFIQISDAVLGQRLKDLYGDTKYGGFNSHEKKHLQLQTLQDVNSLYGDLYDKKTEEEGLSPEDASAFVRKQKRIDTASREARNHFAKLLGYLPGKDGQPGDKDYEAITSNFDFQAADSLVREAVRELS